MNTERVEEEGIVSRCDHCKGVLPAFVKMAEEVRLTNEWLEVLQHASS